jgi:hypothetical protein
MAHVITAKHKCPSLHIALGLPRFSVHLLLKPQEGHIRALDLDRWFPGSLPSWFSRRCAPASQPDLVHASPEWTAAKFCPRCLQQQVQAGLPVHRPVEWAPALVTHCPGHFGQPLGQHCLWCHRQDSGWMITVRGSRKELCCRHCAVALHYWSGAEVPEPLSASLQVTLRLESTLLGCLRGKPLDPFWVGPVHTGAFMSLTAELLSQRDRQGVWTVADHLASGDWWDNHILGYEALTALEGPRALEFFRSHSRVGEKSLYPFAILLRQMSARTEGRGTRPSPALAGADSRARFESRQSGTAAVPRAREVLSLIADPSENCKWTTI